MDMAYLHGLMAENKKEIINTIKKKDMGYLLGMMENNIKDFGKMENRMEKENSFFLLKIYGKKAFGKMEKESSG